MQESLTSLPFRGGEPSLDGGGVSRGIFCLMCKVYEITPQSSLRLASSPKGEPIIHKGEPIIHKREPDNKASPLGEGDQRSWWRGSGGIFLRDVKDLRSYPSVTCGDSSAQGTPCGCPKGEPIIHKGKPIKKSPQHSPLNSREM